MVHLTNVVDLQHVYSLVSNEKIIFFFKVITFRKSTVFFKKIKITVRKLLLYVLIFLFFVFLKAV